MPRQARSHTSNTSPTSFCAATFPSARTERAYWLSTIDVPSFDARTRRSRPSSMSTGSNPVTTMGTPYRSEMGWYSDTPMTEHTCPGPRNARTRFSGSSRIAVIAGGTSTWETSMLKFRSFFRRASRAAMAFAGAVVSKPMAKNTTSRPGFCSAMERASSGE
jgi:hypothetical protein